MIDIESQLGVKNSQFICLMMLLFARQGLCNIKRRQILATLIVDFNIWLKRPKKNHDKLIQRSRSPKQDSNKQSIE